MPALTPQSPALVPELVVETSDDVLGLWEALGTPSPPFWAFPWPGGQVLARHLLDHPHLVRGRSVLDLASGSGIVALAAAAAGARSVTAVDVDPGAGPALRRNAALNPTVTTEVGFCGDDLLGGPPPAVDVVCAGDVCYEGAMAGRMARWLAAAAAAGVTVLVGDPGRPYLPPGWAPTVVARHQVETDAGVDQAAVVTASVYRLAPPGR